MRFSRYALPILLLAASLISGYAKFGFIKASTADLEIKPIP